MGLKWNEFIGQERIKNELYAILQGRKKYGVPNLILSGPFGCGKTTLAMMFGHKLGGCHYYPTGRDKHLYTLNPRHSVGLAAIIIDEIHLTRKWEELYPLLDSDICTISATTRLGKIDTPFMSRCTVFEFSDYSNEELRKIIKVHLKKLMNGMNFSLTPIINRSRGVPRIVINTTIRLMRYLEVHKIKPTEENIDYVLTYVFQIGKDGLTEHDKLYLEVLSSIDKPVGLKTITARTRLHRDYIEEIMEPFLSGLGFIELTMQGRAITKEGLCRLQLK